MSRLSVVRDFVPDVSRVVVPICDDASSRSAGALPQASILAFPFTAIEAVRIGVTRGEADEDNSVALEALRRVGLADFANRFYQDLSGGEQQRVQMARVLAQIPHATTDDDAQRKCLPMVI